MGKYSPEEIKRLDDRMAEMDRLRSDPTMKLVQNKSGKFQYTLKEPELKSLSNKSTVKSKAAASKPASDAYKPGTSSGPLKRPNLSTPAPYRTRGLGVSSEGAREELQALSNRTSPRTNKLPPRKYSAEESKTMASREAGKEGSLTNQYRKESRMKDLEATGTMMATVAGAPTAVGAFEGMTAKELLKGAAGTNPNKLIPYEGANEALKKIGINIPTRFKKGGDVKKLKEPNWKVPKAKASSAGEDAAYVKKEMAFMQKKGAPKSMIKHEKREMNAGGVKKMAVGGMAQMTARSRLGGYVPAGGSMATPKEQLGFYSNIVRGLPQQMGSTALPGGPAGRLGMPGSKPQVKPLKKGGGIEKKGSSPVQKFAKGGSIDGCAVRGKTRAKGRK